MSPIRLKSSHLYLDAAIARELFGDASKVDMVYYPERRSLLLCAPEKEFFHKLHKTSLVMLKDRNVQGDKTIMLGELLIDHDIDNTDRDLNYDVRPETKILSVEL
jgi:hypothetical protein